MRAVISGVKVSARVDVLEYADYYAMGSVARSGGTMQYRYGYQGQYAEKDKETEWNSFELRQYDAVVGRWLSPDPYGQYNSPYVGMGNDWVNNVDPDGGFTDPVYSIINGVQVVTMNGITSVALKEVVVTGTRAGGAAAAAMSIATSTNRAGQQVQGPPDGLLDYSDVVQHMGNRSWTDPSNNKKWYTTYDGVAIEPAPTMGMPPDVGFAPMKFIKFKDVLKKAPDAVKWLRGLSLIKLLDVNSPINI